MRKDNLKRHMKKHESKNNKDKKGMLNQKLSFELKEFNRKKEMGRKIIWVIGAKGNEGKSFFQERVCEEFGHDKVC